MRMRIKKTHEYNKIKNKKHSTTNKIDENYHYLVAVNKEGRITKKERDGKE